MARGMKVSFDVHFTYDCVFFWVATIIACIVVDAVHCTIFKYVESTMTMPIKVWKLFLVKNINLLLNMVGERWETSFCMGVPFSKTIVTTMSWKIVDCNMLTFAQTSKQVNTQIGMSTLTTWKMCNYRI
jgi:hypothetical protein